MQTRGGKIGNADQDIGEPGFRVDVVEACRGDEGKHNGGAVGAVLGTGEGPVAPSQSNTAQRSFGRVVAEADSAVVDEAGEVGPAPEHVVDWLQDFGRAREGIALAKAIGGVSHSGLDLPNRPSWACFIQMNKWFAFMS